MTTGTITGTVTQTAILGSEAYLRMLDIAAAGDIAPTVGGSAGIFDPRRIAGATIDNQGRITGAYGVPNGGVGGIGVDLLASASLTNSGTIIGGAASFYDTVSNGFVGGTGVNLLAGGSVSNTGLIQGGAGGYGAGASGAGGTGLFAADGTFSDSGTITGGAGSMSAVQGEPGPGGIGVHLVEDSAGTNSGTITGGTGQYDGSRGGIGVLLSRSTMTNTGTIIGGEAGFGYFGGFGGGVGVSLVNNATLTDSGQIFGGYGGAGHNAGFTGGAGVTVSNARLYVSGSVTGGTGGKGSEIYAGYGGAGVILTGGLVELTGTGVIQGGAVETGSDPETTGGDGVRIDGGTLYDYGTIAGGSLTDAAYPGRAVSFFGGASGTLVLGTHAVLEGRVAAISGDGDALVLAAGGAGTLTGLGGTITGFDTITVGARAHWTLSGATTLTATENLQDRASLTLGGALSGAGTITLDAGSTLIATAGLSGAGVAFSGAATLVLDKVASVTSTLSGFSTGDTIDLAKLKVTSADYMAGTLTLENGTTTVGTLAFSGSFSQDNFHVASDGHAGTDITFVASAPAEHSPAALDLFEPGRGIWESFLHGILK